jgi:hypothetical protein
MFAERAGRPVALALGSAFLTGRVVRFGLFEAFDRTKQAAKLVDATGRGGLS